MPVPKLQLQFLGTSSAVSTTRNVSSLLVRADQHSIMVDCGEGTVRRLMERAPNVKCASIRHILITHLHADHVLGLVPLLMTLMGPSSADEPSTDKPRVQIYGPAGLRSLVRTTLTLTYATLSSRFAVHELLWPHEVATPHSPLAASTSSEPAALYLGAVQGPQRCVPHLPPHEAELPGLDFRMDEATASWPKFAQVAGLTISAGPLLHRCPTLGFQFQEAPHAAPVDDATIQKLHANAEALKADRGVRNPLSLLGTLVKQRSSITLPDGSVLDPPPFIAEGRRIVVLGDTLDATGGLDDADGARGMLALAADADVLVHEATNIALPPHLTDRKAAAIPAATSIEAEREATRAKALLRGHSTPQVAGSFAKRVGARQLILNHFSVRYGAPNRFAAAKKAGATSGVEDGGEANKGQTDRAAVMKEFEDQATQAWEPEGQARAIAAYDGMEYLLPSPFAADGAQDDIPSSVRAPTPSSGRGRGGGRRYRGPSHNGKSAAGKKGPPDDVGAESTQSSAKESHNRHGRRPRAGTGSSAGGGKRGVSTITPAAESS